MRIRLAAHGLVSRDSDLLTAAGRVGVQQTPPGSAEQALSLRVRDLSGVRNLVQLWSMRGAPHVMPFADAGIFTEGLRPDDEASCRHFIRGAGDHLDRFGLSATALVDLVLEAIPSVLRGRELTKDELGVELAAALPSPPGWTEPDGLRQNTYGESLVRFGLYVAALHGTFRFTRNSRFTLLEEPVPPREDAREELVRRYVRCFGPTTVTEFASWAGVSPDFARRSWERVAPELSEVDYNGRSGWVLDPVDAEVRGVLLLPPYDPLLALRDKDALVEDTAMQRKVWRTTANPGVILHNGVFAGLWRPRKQGRRLTVRIEAVRKLPKRAVESEAEAMGPIRGATSVAVDWQAGDHGDLGAASES